MKKFFLALLLALPLFSADFAYSYHASDGHFAGVFDSANDSANFYRDKTIKNVSIVGYRHLDAYNGQYPYVKFLPRVIVKGGACVDGFDGWGCSCKDSNGGHSYCDGSQYYASSYSTPLQVNFTTIEDYDSYISSFSSYSYDTANTLWGGAYDYTWDDGVLSAGGSFDDIEEVEECVVVEAPLYGLYTFHDNISPEECQALYATHNGNSVVSEVYSVASNCDGQFYCYTNISSCVSCMDATMAASAKCGAQNAILGDFVCNDDALGCVDTNTFSFSCDQNEDSKPVYDDDDKLSDDFLD